MGIQCKFELKMGNVNFFNIKIKVFGSFDLKNRTFDRVMYVFVSAAKYAGSDYSNIVHIQMS